MLPISAVRTAQPIRMRAVDALLEQTFNAEQRHFWFRGFKRFVAPLLRQATAGLTHPRLLDAGCGTGTNLIFLRQYGTPYGLELQWRGLRFGHERGLPRLTQGTVTALPYVDSSMDVVLSFDVLYCLPAPAEAAAISEMHRVLKPGGALIVNVAAMNMLKGDHSVLGGEVRRYTRRGAARKAPARRVSRGPNHPHQCISVPHHRHCAMVPATARTEDGESESGRLLCAARTGERVVLRRARNRIDPCRGRRQHACRKLVAVSGEKSSSGSRSEKYEGPSVRRSGLPERSCGTNVLSVSIVIIPSAAARADAGIFAVNSKSAEGSAVVNIWVPARTVTRGGESK